MIDRCNSELITFLSYRNYLGACDVAFCNLGNFELCRDRAGAVASGARASMVDHQRNSLIHKLPDSDQAFLKSFGSEVTLAPGTVLHDAGRRVASVHFPYGGSVSFLVVSSSGALTEVGFCGNEGAVGSFYDIDDRQTFTRAVVISGATALRLSIDRFDELQSQSNDFRRRIDQANNRVLERAQQIAACNVSHHLEARLSRWLLQSMRHSGQRILLTQEVLSQMLGVTRARVNEALKTLEAAGALVQPTRGVIQVANSLVLGRLSCECATVLRLVPHS